jgi:hypothetical protein
MIRHIILFNLKPEVDNADRDWLFAQIQGLAKISSVRTLAVGKLLDAREAWYKARIWADFAWALTVDFDDEAGLYVYQQDPVHLAVAAEIRQRVSTLKVLDFESLSAK